MRDPFKYYKTSPEIIRLAVMMSALSCVAGPIQTFTVGSQSHSFVSSTEFLPVEVQGPGGTTRPGEATFGERVGHEELHNANPDASEGQVQEMMDRLMPSGRRIRH